MAILLPFGAVVKRLQLQQPLRRIDDDSAGCEIDLLDHLFHRRDQVLLRFALDYVEIAAGRGPDARDRPDAVALCVEDFEADHLVVVILVGAQRWKLRLGNRDCGADPFFRKNWGQVLPGCCPNVT